MSRPTEDPIFQLLNEALAWAWRRGNEASILTLHPSDEIEVVAKKTTELRTAVLAAVLRPVDDAEMVESKV